MQYVIVHTSEFDERQRSQFEEQIGHYASDLHQVAVFGDDLVFETTLQGGDATRQLLRECSFNNEIGLVGFGLNKTAVAPGDSVTLSFLWRSLDEKMTQDYTMFVHLLDEDGRLLTQHDAPPQNKPTSAWLRQEIIRAQSTITIPPGTRNGEAHLIVGVYAWPSLERLPVVCGQAMQGDTIPLTEVAIRITQ
ncbi:MAG: hypothetical protein GY803_02400 [Chloroflexi bacterium]|nr:hypothetical protein [Chloroflexota bacterium]